jgi:hypothetical protein
MIVRDIPPGGADLQEQPIRIHGEVPTGAKLDACIGERLAQLRLTIVLDAGANVIEDRQRHFLLRPVRAIADGHMRRTELYVQTRRRVHLPKQLRIERAGEELGSPDRVADGDPEVIEIRCSYGQRRLLRLRLRASEQSACARAEQRAHFPPRELAMQFFFHAASEVSSRRLLDSDA